MQLYGLSATEFTLLFSSSALLAVVGYLLSFRRRMAVVAADPIWRKVVGRRRTPFRKLLALAGQLLVLFLLSLALGDPRIRAAGSRPPVALVAVVDVSASMGAVEGDGTRLDRAVSLVGAIAEAAGPDDRLLLMAMDDAARPLTPFTADAERLRLALRELKPSALPEDPQAALHFAVNFLSEAGFAEETVRRVVLVSDRFQELLTPEGIQLVQVAVGKAARNLALTALDIRERGGAARGSEVFVEVTNYGPEDQRVRLGIHTAKALLGEEVLAVPAGGKASRGYFLEPWEDRQVMATLTASSGYRPPDGFALDDRAYALVPERRARKVVLVSGGNLFLEKALGLNPSIELNLVPPSGFRPEVLTDALAVVFDGLCEASGIPAAYFNPSGGARCPFATGEAVGFPKLLPLRGDHPVTAGISLVDVQIQTARRLVPLPGDVELLSDQGGPLVVAREKDRLRLLGVGFDPTRSDLPLRVAFPMLLHNALNWLLGDAAEVESLEPNVGDWIALPNWAGSTTRITDPSGRLVAPLKVGAGSLLRPRVPGFYVAGDQKNRWVVPVNFHQGQESDLAGDRRPALDRLLWEGGAAPASLVEGLEKTERPPPTRQWPQLLLAAVWLLLFDWVFFSFRILF